MIEPELRDLAAAFGLEDFFPYQKELFREWSQTYDEDSPVNGVCLYYRTGAGKTITALAALRLLGFEDVLVIAPPITHDQWKSLGERVNMTITTISHAKFRMASFRTSVNTPIICDEYHLLGGHGGKGWQKFDRLAARLKAPVVVCSATPNYNDAERVYCIQHTLDPLSTRGGFLEFLYQHCETRQNPFARLPYVDGFKKYDSAEEYLRALPYVYFVPDVHKVDVVDVPVDLSAFVPEKFSEYGLNDRTQMIEASVMGKAWSELFLKTIDDDGLLREELYDALINVTMDVPDGAKVIYYCDSSQIAEALSKRMAVGGYEHLLVTGKTTQQDKLACVEEFKTTAVLGLVGTATLATGTDGLDRVCDWLVIVHDTSDDSKRKQLIGRILPRGELADASNKHVLRLTY